MRTFLSFLLVTACSACTTNYVMVGSPADVPSEASEPMFQTMDEQVKTAVHEAAHAMYGAAVYGPSYIKEISVSQLCCAGSLHDNLGATSYANRVTANDAPDLREQMAFAFAGRAGDVVILGKPNTGASSDIAAANRIVWGMVNGNSLIGQKKFGFLMAASFSEATSEQKQIMACELENANARAEAYVRENRDAIVMLADIIMHQPVENHARVFKGIGLRVFLKRFAPPLTTTADEPVCVTGK